MNRTIARLQQAQDLQGNMDELISADPFQEELAFYKDESDFDSMGVVSVIGDLLVFNHLSKTFAFIIIRIDRSPAGMLKFSVEHVRPIG